MPSGPPQCFGSQRCSRGWPLPWCSPSFCPCSCRPERWVLPPEHRWVGAGSVCWCLQRFPNRRLLGRTRRQQPASISHLKLVEDLPCGGVALGSCPRSQRRSWTALGCHPACIQSDHWHMLCTRLSWSQHWLPVEREKSWPKWSRTHPKTDEGKVRSISVGTPLGPERLPPWRPLDCHGSVTKLFNVILVPKGKYFLKKLSSWKH